MAVGPRITGNYIANVLSPFVTLAPAFGAIRLARPVSWWAKWFYWGPMDSDRRLLHPQPEIGKGVRSIRGTKDGFGAAGATVEVIEPTRPDLTGEKSLADRLR